MRALLPALLLALLASGCKLAPGGRCDGEGDCPRGQHCSENVCAPDGRSELYAGCAVDRDCDAFALCSRGVCVLAPGRCAETLDCAAWAVCEENTCTPAAGRCDTRADCEAWQLCDASHTCVLASGRCDGTAGCAGWQVCSPTRFCETGPGFCARDAECEEWQRCDASHVCALASGRCDGTAGCAAWQVCSPTRYCETGPGFCAQDADCEAFEACGGDHVCALRPGACGVQDDCPADRVCEAHACVAQPAPASLDPALVHRVGTLEAGVPGSVGLAPLDAPLARLVGLAEGDLACGVRLSPTTGALLYRRGAAALAWLAADAVLWDAGADRWIYPPDPHGNDAAVPLPGCEAALSVEHVLQAGTGALRYACDGLDWRDEAGAVVLSGRPLLAWGQTGRLLSGTPDMLGAPALLDAAGLEIPLSGAPVAEGDRLVAWRADGDGFRVVRALGATAQLADLEVWTIDGTGVAAPAAALPPLPASIAEVFAPLLDGSGAVYQAALTAGGGSAVVKRVPGDAAATVAYDESALPAGTSLLDAPARLDGGGCLVTGP